MSSELIRQSVPFQVESSDLETGGFAAFYRTNRDHIGTCLALTFNDQALGFEAVDEAMTRACRDWPSVAGASNPAGWVFRVGLNWGRSWMRRRVTATRRAPDIALLGRLHSEASRSIESLAEDTVLADAVAVLGDDARAVVVLRFYQDWTVPQIAEALGVPEGTVKSRLSRALDQLRHNLTTEAEGEQA